jgi:hypothetical protein
VCEPEIRVHRQCATKLFCRLRVLAHEREWPTRLARRDDRKRIEFERSPDRDQGFAIIGASDMDLRKPLMRLGEAGIQVNRPSE